MDVPLRKLASAVFADLPAPRPPQAGDGHAHRDGSLAGPQGLAGQRAAGGGAAAPLAASAASIAR